MQAQFDSPPRAAQVFCELDKDKTGTPQLHSRIHVHVRHACIHSRTGTLNYEEVTQLASRFFDGRQPAEAHPRY